MEEEVVITNTSIVLLVNNSPKDEVVESQYNLSVASSGISCSGADSSGNPSLLTQNDSLFGGESKRSIYALLKSSRILTNQGDILIRNSHDEDTNVLCHEASSSQSLSLSECNNPSELSVILSRKSSLILEADSKTSDRSTPTTTTVSASSLNEKLSSTHHPRGSLTKTTVYEHQIVSLHLEPEHPIVACDSESVVWRCTGGPYLRKVRRRIQSKETLLDIGTGRDRR
ncbi:uncharacterized protein LOC131882751 [Tigriopus californicus]|nr:uncharacterized protein LOC131882751 [Tigriopus californicus]